MTTSFFRNTNVNGTSEKNYGLTGKRRKNYTKSIKSRLYMNRKVISAVITANIARTYFRGKA